MEHDLKPVMWGNIEVQTNKAANGKSSYRYDVAARR